MTTAGYDSKTIYTTAYYGDYKFTLLKHNANKTWSIVLEASNRQVSFMGCIWDSVLSSQFVLSCQFTMTCFIQRQCPLLRSHSMVTDKWLCSKHWRNDNDYRNLGTWEINQSQCHFVHQQSHQTWPGTEPHPLWLLTTQNINKTNVKCCCETKTNL